MVTTQENNWRSASPDLSENNKEFHAAHQAQENVPDFVGFQEDLESIAATTHQDLKHCRPSPAREHLKATKRATLALRKADKMTLASNKETVARYTNGVQKAYASMLGGEKAMDTSTFAASRLKPLAAISTTGSALPLFAHSHLRPVQDHIMDVVEGYCRQKPDWVNTPMINTTKLAPTIRDQRSQIKTLAWTLLGLTERRRSDPDSETAVQLLLAVQRRNKIAFKETNPGYFEEARSNLLQALEAALPTDADGARNGERVCRSSIPTADLRIFDAAKRTFEGPVKAFSDQIKSLDFTRPPRLRLPRATHDSLKSRSKWLLIRKTEAGSHKQPLDEQYADYLWNQYTRVQQMRPAISSLFETGQALLALENGNSELAERLLTDTIERLSDLSVIEPPPRSTGSGPPISASDTSCQADHALNSTTEERQTSESLRPSQDPSMFYQRTEQVPAPDRVPRFVVSLLTEALQNRGYSKRGERVAGSVKDDFSVAEGSDMTVVS